MAFKLNISENGKAWKLEFEGPGLIGKSVGDKLNGTEIGSDFEGYELEIRGGSDKSGFPLSKDVEGIGMKRVLLTKGWGMRDSRKGIRKRKSVRGKQISDTTVQINMSVMKAGKKPLAEIFPEQNKEKVEEGKIEEKQEKEEVGEEAEEIEEKKEEKAEEKQEKEEKKKVKEEEKVEEKTEGKQEEAEEKVAEEMEEGAKMRNADKKVGEIVKEEVKEGITEAIEEVEEKENAKEEEAEEKNSEEGK